jgi:uncharacterized Zn-binding protein involved in type VI secretion
MSGSIYAYKGEIIQCPTCHLDLLEFVRDIYRGDVMRSADVRGIGLVPAPSNGDRCECPECGSAYARPGRAHIKGVGWV